MSKRSSTDRLPNIGSSSLLVVFLVVIMATFAVLSLSTARSDSAFTEKLADRKTAYYQACNTAESLVAAIDTLLSESYEKGMTEEAYFEAAASALSHKADELDLTLTSGEDSSKGPLISFAVEAGQDTILSVSLRAVCPEEAGDAFYRITEWKTQSTAEWHNDTPISLIPVGSADD